MMGPTNLKTIRAKVRKAFKMPDTALRAWFDRQLDELGQRPKTNKTAIETLRLLRDALVKETKRKSQQHKPPPLTGRSKS